MVPLRSDVNGDSWDTTLNNRPSLQLVDYSDDIEQARQKRLRISYKRRQQFIDNIAVSLVLAIVIICGISSGAAMMHNNNANQSHEISLTVKPGDSLWKYAQQYGDPNVYILDRIDQIAGHNHLSGSQALTPGQQLKIVVKNPVLLAKLNKHIHIASAK